MPKASTAVSLTDDLRQGSTPVVLAQDRTLPVVDALAGLFLGAGLQQGSTVEVEGTAAVSLAVALTVGVTSSNRWVAAVGLPELGSSAAVDLGAQFQRWAFVDWPKNQAAEVLYALMGAVDLILVGPDIKMRANHGRKSQRGCVNGAPRSSPLVMPAVVIYSQVFASELIEPSGQVYNVVTVSWLLAK